MTGVYLVMAAAISGLLAVAIHLVIRRFQQQNQAAIDACPQPFTTHTPACANGTPQTPAPTTPPAAPGNSPGGGDGHHPRGRVAAAGSTLPDPPPGHHPPPPGNHLRLYTIRVFSCTCVYQWGHGHTITAAYVCATHRPHDWDQELREITQ